MNNAHWGNFQFCCNMMDFAAIFFGGSIVFSKYTVVWSLVAHYTEKVMTTTNAEIKDELSKE